MPVRASPYLIAPLDRSHDRSSFACGVADLDRYLKQQARQDADRRVAAPFVLTEPPSLVVLGFYTLSASVVTADELPPTLAKKLPRYPQLPVVLLGRLTVDTRLKGSQQGEHLLMDALCRSLDATSRIGAMAVLVEAKNEAAQAFYRHFGFMPLTAPANRLFLPMATVAELFG